MEYRGRYEIFDCRGIGTYPVADRTNKVKLADLVDPATSAGKADAQIVSLADHIVQAVRAGQPVIWFFGAHLVKNGLGPLMADLINRGAVSLAATNGAGIIHDYELALMGETSEDVPNALSEGQFGMAAELGYLNAAIAEGDDRCWGFGESVGALIGDPDFRTAVQKRLGLSQPIEFKYPRISMIAACHENKIPMTAHVGIGTDVIDQHPNFDGRAKGGCSGRDFLIYARQVARLTNGGVVLNIGSAVTGPEVLLKAVSMAGNIGKPPRGLITADFDLKPYDPLAMTDESSCSYYYRHHKSVVTRIPQTFDGQGLYIHGDQKTTLPALYRQIVDRLSDLTP